ncbi:MAG TPA: hypothetical protein VHR47_02270 [Bacillota bacterium]|jgi:hypothetical protein|nr:hypothetical protein [Bacillota bacterium]
MFRPVDLQVLIARTLEVQKQQGVMTKMAEGEGEEFRRRLQIQVEEEQRQVQRKKGDISLKIGKRPEHRESNGEYNQRAKKAKKEQDKDALGQNIDLEI